MKFEWDESKSDACFQQRGFDFAYVAHAFADPRRTVRPDNRFDYGEERFELLAAIESRIFVLVFTKRGDAIRIISARRANPREVRRYEDHSLEN